MHTDMKVSTLRRGMISYSIFTVISIIMLEIAVLQDWPTAGKVFVAIFGMYHLILACMSVVVWKFRHVLSFKEEEEDNG